MENAPEKAPTSWIPSLVFGAGVFVSVALGIIAPTSLWYGICAALVYGAALTIAGYLEQKKATAGDGGAAHRRLLKYTGLTYIVLIFAAMYFPGWVSGLVLAFGVEGTALLRNTPRCATLKLHALWQKLRQ